MYSLNVPVPPEVARLAIDLTGDLPAARPRERGAHTLVCKRLGDPDVATAGGPTDAYHRLEARVREALAGTAPFAARVAGVDRFDEAVTGPSPVVYLAVESPALERIHTRLCEAFDPVAGLEDEAYVPHVTVARGGSPERAAAVCERSVDPVEWTVSEFELRDAERGQTVSTLSLPR